MAPFLGNTELAEEPDEQPVTLDSAVIALLVMTVTGVTGKDYNPIGTFFESLENELRVNPSTAHDLYDIDIRGTGKLCRSGLVRSRI